MTKGQKVSGKKNDSPDVNPKRKGGTSISMKTYRALRNAYVERPSIRHAARVAGVRFETARKYIIEGRPDKNMPAIEGIAKAESQKEQAVFELDLRSFRNEYRGDLKEALAGSMLEIRLHNARTKKLAEKAASEAKKKGGEIVEPSSMFVHQVKAHDMLIRLMERSFGEADEKVSIEPVDFTKQMTAAECVAYIKSGEIPERLR